MSHSDLSQQSNIAYKSALIAAESDRIDAEINAISSALNWMAEKRELDAKQKSSDLAEITYNDAKIRYEIGEISLDDLQQSLIAWSQGRVELSVKQQDFRDSVSSLYSLIGSSPDLISIDEFDINYLEYALNEIKDELNPQIGDPLKNENYQTSLLELEGAESHYKSTWAYEPDLKVKADLNFDTKGSMSMSALLEFKLSLDDFQKKEKEIAREEFQNSINRAEQNRDQVELEFEQTIEALTTKEINREISLIELEQSRILLSEAELLYRIGEYSELELEQSCLNLELAENSFFRALADEYIAWIALRKYL